LHTLGTISSQMRKQFSRRCELIENAGRTAIKPTFRSSKKGFSWIFAGLSFRG
jgi:hypothetical protein